jgi:hypothetical protein
MSLTAGTKFCPYEIQSPLGAGGTGEAYRRYTQLPEYLAILAATVQILFCISACRLIGEIRRPYLRKVGTLCL